MNVQDHRHPLCGGASPPESPSGHEMKSSDTVLSVADITGSGEASNLDRRLACMSGTMFSWRGIPKPLNHMGVEEKDGGVLRRFKPGL